MKFSEQRYLNLVLNLNFKFETLKSEISKTKIEKSKISSEI